MRVSLRCGIVGIPWSSRNALVERVQILEGMHDLRDAFLDVADHAAVCLSEVQKAGLLNVISFWANEMDDGYDGLPEGVYELRNALHDDLHHVGVDVSDD